jgi:HEAT repeat protein
VATSSPLGETPAGEEIPPRGDEVGRRGRRPGSIPPARAGKGRLILWSLVAGGVAVLALGGVGLWLLTREATIPDAEWKEFPVKGQHFRVLLPGTPKPALSQGKLTAGSLYGVERENGKVAFLVGYAPIPAFDLQRVPWEQRFKAALQGTLANQPGSKVRTEKAVSLDGHPGKEYEAEVPQKGTLVIRFYGVNDEDEAQFYTLMVGSPAYSAASADVRKFFDSFRLLGAPGHEFETPVDPAELNQVFEGKTLAQWVKELEYQDPANRPGAAIRRGEAARALARFGPKARAAIPALAKVYRTDLDGVVRSQAAGALAEMAPGSKNAIPALLKILRSNESGYQARAAEGLAKFGAEVVPTLIQLVPQPGAVKALGLIGPAAKDAVPALTDMLKDRKNPWAIQNAVDALGRIGPAAKDAVPALTELLKENHPRRPGPDNGGIRLGTAAALVRIDPRNDFARKVLKECRTDPNDSVRLAASAALIRVDPQDKDSLRYLTDLVKKGWGGPAIHALGDAGPNAKEAFPLLREVALKDKNDMIRKDAVTALAKIDPPAAVQVLIKALKDPHSWVRFAALDELGKMGAAAKEAIPALQEALKAAKEPETRHRATRALDQIQGTKKK